jgi:hypothetical protein
LADHKRNQDNFMAQRHASVNSLLNAKEQEFRRDQ